MESHEVLRIGWICLNNTSSSTGKYPLSISIIDPENKSTTTLNLDFPQALFSWLSGSRIIIDLFRTAKENEQGHEARLIFWGSLSASMHTSPVSTFKFGMWRIATTIYKITTSKLEIFYLASKKSCWQGEQPQKHNQCRKCTRHREKVLEKEH